MSKFVEISAKNVNEAIDLALKELKIDREMAEVEIIEEGSKGIFGVIGNKMAKVKVRQRVLTGGEIAKRSLSNIFKKMNVDANIDVTENDGELDIVISGEEVGILIGRRGETLDSLQYLTSLVVNKEQEKYKKIVLDIEDYRKKREDTLIRLANKLSERVIKFKKSITLEPMTSYERRVIHAALQNNRKVDTYSVGNEPYRKIVIKLR